MRILLLSLGAWSGVFLAVSAWFFCQLRKGRWNSQQPTVAGSPTAGFASGSGSDPLDGMSPEACEAYDESWWDFIESMPEYELEASCAAYRAWVRHLPEQVS